MREDNERDKLGVITQEKFRFGIWGWGKCNYVGIGGQSWSPSQIFSPDKLENWSCDYFEKGTVCKQLGKVEYVVHQNGCNTLHVRFFETIKMQRWWRILAENRTHSTQYWHNEVHTNASLAWNLVQTCQLFLVIFITWRHLKSHPFHWCLEDIPTMKFFQTEIQKKNDQA